MILEDNVQKHWRSNGFGGASPSINWSPNLFLLDLITLLPSQKYLLL